jgi:purine-binding chemotaxis protein CheW
MDLLEIRKKAKGLKEAGEAAAQEASKAAAQEAAKGAVSAEADDAEAAGKEAPAPETGKDAAPAKPPAKLRAKRRRKKAEKPAHVPLTAPEAEGAALPGLLDALADVLVEEIATAQVHPGPMHDDAGWDDGADDDAGEVVEYLAFRLASEEYAVKVEDVKEIIRLQRITQVPRAPEFVLGIISLRGVIIPVFDIKKRLGLDATERTRSTRIVVLSEKGAPQGIIVDKVTGVARLDAAGIEPPPAVIGGVEGEFIEGIGRLDARLLILFNTSKVLEMEG